MTLKQLRAAFKAIPWLRVMRASYISHDAAQQGCLSRFLESHLVLCSQDAPAFKHGEEWERRHSDADILNVSCFIVLLGML
jgi:hypothetical protein